MLCGMALLDLRARSPSEIIDGTFQLYRRDAGQYILAAAVAHVPWLVAQLLLRWAAGGGDALIGAGTMFLVLMAGGLVSSALMSAVLVRYASEVYLGRPADLAATVRAVLPRLAAVIGAGIVKTVLMFAGFMLFVAPGIYVAATFFATEPAIVIEGRGVFDAFGRSNALATGRRWHILGTLALVFLLYFLGQLALGAVTGVVGSQVLNLVAQSVYTIVVYPLIGITEMLLYYDARIRAEGFDIEMMAGSLGPAPAAGGLAG